MSLFSENIRSAACYILASVLRFRTDSNRDEISADDIYSPLLRPIRVPCQEEIEIERGALV